jgi:hypothetical protein
MPIAGPETPLTATIAALGESYCSSASKSHGLERYGAVLRIFNHLQEASITYTHSQ